MREEFNILVLVRRNQKYIFLYTDENYDELIKTFDRFVANPELKFNQKDADILKEKAKQSLQPTSLLDIMTDLFF